MLLFIFGSFKYDEADYCCIHLKKKALKHKRNSCKMQQNCIQTENGRNLEWAAAFYCSCVQQMFESRLYKGAHGVG